MSSPLFDLVVSIVIYKPHMAHLQETIDSLSKTPLKIKLVIHDNSPERTAIETLRSFHKIDYFWKAKNLGFGRGHNWNIKKCIDDSKYFLILNPDIFFNETLIVDMCQRMDKDSALGLSIPKICHPSGGLQMVNRRVPRPQDYLFNFINSHMGRRVLTSPEYNRYLLNDINLSQPFECPQFPDALCYFAVLFLKNWVDLINVFSSI